MKFKNKIAMVVLAAFVLAGLSGCAAGMTQAEQTGTSTEATNYAVSFTDDMGNQINLTQPCTKIISLYSAHTENLYSLGVGNSVAGVNSTAIFPPDAATKPVYDYSADPETVIAADPDLVLIRPFINRKNPDFVEALENAGLTVVSLYPETLDSFDDYIEKLAMLTGCEDTAAQKLKEFHEQLSAISAVTGELQEKQSVFFESTDVNIRTITSDSMPALAIEMAGGVNIAGDQQPISEGSSIAAFGAEKVLGLADEIDVYVSQSGAMNAGGNAHTISIRPGFETIKAVRDGRIYQINEKIISSPTFNFYKGVHEMARYLYPDVMDTLNAYQTDEKADKRDLANILVRSAHQPVFIPSSSKYYDTEQEGHTYGWFEDMPWTDADFDYTETAVMAGWIDYKEAEGKEYFNPDEAVTREMLAKAIFMMGDYKKLDDHIEIKDIDQCAVPEMVQTLVDNGIFELNDGLFYPQEALTQNQIVEIVDKL